MAQKKRSVSLSNTVYVWLEDLVSTGEYSDLDAAATDLLMQVKRGTHLNQPRIESIKTITNPVLASTNPVPMSTHTKPIAVEPPKPSLGPTIAATSETPADELARLQGLPKLEKLKHIDRITELKQLIEA